MFFIQQLLTGFLFCAKHHPGQGQGEGTIHKHTDLLLQSTEEEKGGTHGHSGMGVSLTGDIRAEAEEEGTTVLACYRVGGRGVCRIRWQKEITGLWERQDRTKVMGLMTSQWKS